MSEQRLTPRQERFAQEFVRDLNATAAYKRAGYKGVGHSAESAAARLLSNVEVAARVAELQAERAGRVQVDADWVLRRLMREGELTGEGASHSARVRALELVGKHLGMFSDSNVSLNLNRGTGWDVFIDSLVGGQDDDEG